MINLKQHNYFLRFLVLNLVCFHPHTVLGSDDFLVLDADQKSSLSRWYEEHQTHELMQQLSMEYQPGTLAMVDVNVISMTNENLMEHQTVIVENGKFSVIGKSSDVTIPEGATVIHSAKGKYLIPGLTEGHAHTQFSLSQFLVYLTRGVTTVREMDGFPWMLKARDMAARNELMIPNLYVAGHILSNRAWPFYMTQVDTVEEVQELVSKQALAGFDFIKIHNSMPEPLYSALFETANKFGLDVVGHIPNEILIIDAISAGQRTNEHFKGYIFDENLSITDQDYVKATKGSELWNAPSFANYHEHLRGQDALRVVIEENSLRLVPQWMRTEWQAQADQPMDGLTELRQTIYPKSREIYASLAPVTGKFFAGTDTGGYAYQVPGYALQEEIRIFESLGLSPYEALQTATINTAKAMRKAEEMGSIDVGKRADFVVLDKNPLESSSNLASIQGVAIRGVWLNHETLINIEQKLEEIFRSDLPSNISIRELLLSIAKEIETRKNAGFPYPEYLLDDANPLFDLLDKN